MDVKTAYLHALKDNVIYMKPPKGYGEKDGSLVHKLEKFDDHYHMGT